MGGRVGLLVGWFIERLYVAWRVVECKYIETVKTWAQESAFLAGGVCFFVCCNDLRWHTYSEILNMIHGNVSQGQVL